MRSRFREISSLPAYRNEPCKARPASSSLVESSRRQLAVSRADHRLALRLALIRERERERERERTLSSARHREANRNIGENRSYVYPLSSFIPESYSPMNTPSRFGDRDNDIIRPHRSRGRGEGRAKSETRGSSRAALAGPDLLRRAA
jgi:hypothetical protein